MKWLHNLLLRSAAYKRLVRWSQQTSLPGFEKLPIYTVLTFFIKEVQKEHLNTKSASLAFSFLLALFPATIFLFTLIPYIPIKNFQDQLMYILLQVLPKEAFLAIKTTLVDIVENQNGGLLSFGFIAALFFSTNGMMALMRSFNKASLVPETRTGIKQRMVAVLLTLGLSLLIVTGISLIVAGEFFVKLLKSHAVLTKSYSYYLALGLNWVVIIGLFFCVISTLYHFAPAAIRQFRFVSAGSTLATFLSILSSLGFAYYVNHFGSYNKLYGSIGTLIVVMIWLYLNSMILLIGFELNASIHIIKRNLPPPPKSRTGNKLRQVVISDEEQ